MSSSYSVTLPGPAPWGFRLQGGKDFCLPLTISRLTDGGKAADAKMSIGDIIHSINGVSTDGMNHLEAQNKIKACTGNLSLTLQRPSTAPPTAEAPKDQPREIIKPVPISQPAPSATNASAKPSTQPSPAYNKTARPFGGGSGGAVTGSPSLAAPKVASIPSESSAFTPAAPSQPPQPPFPLKSSVATPDPAPATSTHVLKPSPAPQSVSSSSSKSSSPAKVAPPSSHPSVPQSSVYNTPIKLYSNVNACEVAMGQRRGLLESQGLTELVNGTPPPTRPRRKPATEPDPHTSPLSDASKKRVIEDTEDWHPRSGTSQSRSFQILAQLTGTENEQVPEKTGKSEAVDKAAPMVHASPAAKTKTTAAPRNGSVAPASTLSPVPQNKPSHHPGGPSGFPKVGASPSFGKVTNPAPRGPDRPTPQPHPEDLNSLVQRAEHIPAGTRTPVCNKCNQVIRGPFLVAMGMSWHSEEFNCAHCHSSLANRGFVEEKGQVYCERCYEQYLAPTCNRCHQKILGEVMNALKQTWHVSCFTCTACHQPIRGNMFHMEDGQPYCERDYYKLFGTNCHGCDFPIEAGDKFLQALGVTWHDTCFVCAVCSTNLEGQPFFSKKDKPLCKKHAHTVNI